MWAVENLSDSWKWSTVRLLGATPTPATSVEPLSIIHRVGGLYKRAAWEAGLASKVTALVQEAVNPVNERQEDAYKQG